MRPTGSAAELEARRRRAVVRLQEGLGIRPVARHVGASPSSVTRWKEVVAKRGTEALVAKPHPGRPARLSARQKQRLLVKVGTAKEISIKELVELIADIISLLSQR